MHRENAGEANFLRKTELYETHTAINMCNVIRNIALFSINVNANKSSGLIEMVR